MIVGTVIGYRRTRLSPPVAFHSFVASRRRLQEGIVHLTETMTSNAPKTPKEDSQRSNHSRPFWKRLSRRESKSGAASIDGSVPVEPDNGDGRSLLAKRDQRLAKKQGGLIRKLKNSFRRTSSTQQDDVDGTLPVQRQASETSNVLNSPAGYSTESYVTVEVSWRDHWTMNHLNQ